MTHTLAHHTAMEKIKFIGDIAAGGTAVATLVGWLPSIAALLAIIYTGYRIYDLWDIRRNERRGIRRDNTKDRRHE